MKKTFEELTDDEIDAKLEEELKNPKFKDPPMKFNPGTMKEEPVNPLVPNFSLPGIPDPRVDLKKLKKELEEINHPKPY